METIEKNTVDYLNTYLDCIESLKLTSQHNDYLNAYLDYVEDTGVYDRIKFERQRIKMGGNEGVHLLFIK